MIFKVIPQNETRLRVAKSKNHSSRDLWRSSLVIRGRSSGRTVEVCGTSKVLSTPDGDVTALFPCESSGGGRYQRLRIVTPPPR